MNSAVNVADKLRSFDELWSPKVIGELNGQYVKVVKAKGEYVWHKHDDEDEMFMVVSGTVMIQLRDGDVELREGEFFIVPRGVEHRPVAQNEVHLLLFEPASTRNTGEVTEARTIEPENLDRI